MAHSIPRSTLERFAAGAASREENRAVVAHLLKGCALCVQVLQETDYHEEMSPSALDAALDRFEREVRGAVTAPSGRLTVLREVLEEGRLMRR